MVDARFEIDPERMMLSLKVKGHAGANRVGSDLVCASASILAYTLAQNCKYAEAKGQLRAAFKPKLKNGDANITVRCKNIEAFAELSHTFCVIQTGYQVLAHNYPGNATVTLFGETETQS